VAVGTIDALYCIALDDRTMHVPTCCKGMGSPACKTTDVPTCLNADPLKGPCAGNTTVFAVFCVSLGGSREAMGSSALLRLLSCCKSKRTMAGKRPPLSGLSYGIPRTVKRRITLPPGRPFSWSECKVTLPSSHIAGVFVSSLFPILLPVSRACGL